MKESDQRFWPYKPKVTILSAIILLIVLLLIFGILRSTITWPPDISTNTILLGILLISLFPVLLAILDVIIDRGGKIGYGDFIIDFQKAQLVGNSGFTVPANIGVRGQPVADSGTSNILNTLKDATSCGIVVIDLEDGHAWWETRLLVLLSGANRLGKPDKIVFVGTNEGMDQCFLGWAHPTELLHQLLKENQRYQKSFHASLAAARQWELLGSLETPLPPNVYYTIPATPPWMRGSLAINHGSWAFSVISGLPNELLAEQLLQHELGEIIEKKEGSKHINIVRLDEVFKPVLNRKRIEKNWSNELQTNALLSSDAPFIAITENGRYSAIVSIQLLINEMLRNKFNITQG